MATKKTGSKGKRTGVNSRERMVAFLMAWDIVSIQDGMNHDDYEFIVSILNGDGWTQYGKMSDAEIQQEFDERFADYEIDDYTALASKLLS